MKKRSISAVFTAAVTAAVLAVSSGGVRAAELSIMPAEESAGISSAAADAPIFPDVKIDAWYAEYVSEAVRAGRVDGYEDGTFQPERAVSYAEFISMMTNRQTGEDPGTFSHWGTGVYAYAVEHGWFTQEDIPIRRLALPIPREDMALITAGALKAFGYPIKNVPESSYKDVSSDDENEYEIMVCTALGILEGYEGGLFKPAGNLKRSEAVKVVMTADKLLAGVLPEAPKPDPETTGASGPSSREELEEIIKIGETVISYGSDLSRILPEKDYEWIRYAAESVRCSGSRNGGFKVEFRRLDAPRKYCDVRFTAKLLNENYQYLTGEWYFAKACSNLKEDGLHGDGSLMSAGELVQNFRYPDSLPKEAHITVNLGYFDDELGRQVEITYVIQQDLSSGEIIRSWISYSGIGQITEDVDASERVVWNWK